MARLRGAPERHPAFDGFDDYFGEKIAPALSSLDTDRAKTARDCLLIVAGALVFFAGAIWLAIAVFHSFALGFVGFMLAGAIVVFGLNWRMEDIYARVNTVMIGGIAEFLELNHTHDATRPRSLGTFRKQNLVPKNNAVECGDIIEGVWVGVKFACSEAWLSYRATDGGSERSVFAGQLFRIDLPFSLQERVTLIGRKERIGCRRKPHAGAVNLTAHTTRLKPHYTVWGTAETAARVLAAHGLEQKLVSIAQRYDNRKIRLWFDRNRVYIAVNNGDQLAPGSMFTPLGSPRRVREAIAGFSQILLTVEAFAP